ncbi:indole-3-glycerol-phosphate synthase, partial [Halorubrum sp. SD626R]
MEDDSALAPAVESILTTARERAAEGRTDRVDVAPRDLRAAFD